MGKNLLLLFGITTLILLLCIAQGGNETALQPHKPQHKAAPKPYTATIANLQAPYKALLQARLARECAQGAGMGKWQFAGPANISGRITDVAMHPADTNTIYAAAASGGVFKSVNQGNTWIPVFDEQLSLSIGSIAIHPGNPNILYVGTGEANAGGGSITYDGTGMYKSTDAGATWQQTGLTQSGSIAQIAIDPQNPQRIFVAAMGKLFRNNAERGLYRSNNGGKNWEKVLYISEATGCVDVVLNPKTPNIVYAVMWERIRRPQMRKYGGNNCGIYRSADGGTTWQKLQNGLPDNNLGRIGIAVSASNPLILYAIYADEQGYFKGLYKTTNGGNSWYRVNDRYLNNLYENYGWWFGKIYIHPQNPDAVYVLGLDLCQSLNGGQSWRTLSTQAVHMDQHALYIHPQNPQLMVLGNDGGVYLSHQSGNTWQALNGPPVVQFYTCETDRRNPTRLYGGAQDNGILRTKSGLPDDWEILIDGDGFGVLIDPVNSDMFYAAYQYGSLLRSFDGGYTLFDATEGIDNADRKNWHTPFVIDPLQSHVLYYGANRLYKSTDRGVQWYAVSPDLSKGGVKHNASYGAISAIAVAPNNNDMVYAGTDDGNLWVAYKNCTDWIDISAGLPAQWVSSIAVNPMEEKTAYVAFSGYRQTDYLPHLFKTNNAGISWQDVSANLPEAPVNKLLIDPTDTATVYIATDVGVFFSANGGGKWQMLGDNLPPVPVTDLCLQTRERKLVAATYGRGMFTFSLSGNMRPKLPLFNEN